MLKEIKTNFPFFSAKGGSASGGKNHPGLAYLDNASSTQTCAAALEAMNDYYLQNRANVHRAAYDLAGQATDSFERSREQIAKFINAEPQEIIFTSGTTHGLNLLAYTLSPRLTHRDNIVLTRLEHHANLVPWQEMARHYGFQIRFIELTDYLLDLESAKKVIDKNTKIVSFALVSNVLGSIAPAKELIALGQAVGATTIVDAAQAAAHLPIDVKKLDCDFLVFSGHKMYGPTGIGILFGKNDLLQENLEPFFYGGDMVKSVSFEKAEWADLPNKFEAGTPNIAGAIGLGAAAEFLQNIGWDKIIKHETELTDYALERLDKEVNIFGPTLDPRFRGDDSGRIGVVSFTIPGIHPHDISEILNRHQIATRAGFHCAEPLHRLFNLNGTTRLSIGLYNSKEEIDRLAEALLEVKQIFSKYDRQSVS